jgi:hypothetical protein
MELMRGLTSRTVGCAQSIRKVMAHQLLDDIEHMVHQDQTSFIPKRLIYNNIRLARTIIKYAELTHEDEDGAIVALDQKKAYDKTLYQHARTRVVINGMLCSPFQVTHRVRQGHPLSCALVDVAIEPLACKLREDP